MCIRDRVINAPELQQPTEYRSLFARWTISTSISDRGIDIGAEAAAAPGRAGEAEAAFAELVQTWQDSPATRAGQAQFARAEMCIRDSLSRRLTAAVAGLARCSACLGQHLLA